jgi:hypothetical protein
MRRNLMLALIVATLLFLVNDIAPSPMGCSPQGCVADVARRWAKHDLGQHLASFILPFLGLFVVFQWVAPAILHARARARERMWGRDPDL